MVACRYGISLLACSTRYLTSERSERVRYRVEHSKRNSISTSAHVLYRGYYMAARGYEFYLRVLLVSLTSERSERVRDASSTRT